MSFFNVPLRYAFKNCFQHVFGVGVTTQPTSTFASTTSSFATHPDSTIPLDERLAADPLLDSILRSTSIDSIATSSHLFEPKYFVKLRTPRNHAEAQQLYNHIRTVAWYLDALPFFSNRLSFNIGIDSIIGILPGLGDYLGLLFGLYQIFLCSLFGLPYKLLFWMLVSIIVDCLLGIIPFIGDLLDAAFKANLRNLYLLEEHLKKTKGKCGAGQFYLEFPSNQTFLPSPQTKKRFPVSSSLSHLHSKSSGLPKSTLRSSFSSTEATSSAFMAIPWSVVSQAEQADHPVASNALDGDTRLPPPDADQYDQVLAYTIAESDDDDLPIETNPTVGQALLQNNSPFPIGSGISTSASQNSDLQPTSQALHVSPPQTWRAPQRKNSVDIHSFDGSLNDHEESLLGTSPDSSRHHLDPFVDLGLGSLRKSNGDYPIRATTPTESGRLLDTSIRKTSTPSSASSPGQCPVEASSNKDKGRSRRGVSWHVPQTDYTADDSDPDTIRPSSGLISRRDRRTEAQDLWRKRKAMYMVVYSAIFCVAYMMSLDSSTAYLYLNFACSEYGALTSFSTVAIVQQMIYAVAKPPIAKLSDVFGRAEAYILSMVLYISGYLIVASTNSLRSLIGGICLQSAGTTGVQVLQSIIIADTTTAKWRGLVIGIVNLPFLINFAVAGPLVDLVMRHGGWRVGYTLWTVLVPLSATPLLITLAVGQRRARRAGLITRNPLAAKTWREAIRELARELDAIGLLLFTGGWLVVLLPLTLAGYGEQSRNIAPQYFFICGAMLLGAFGWWETKAAVPILPFQFFTNRAVVCVCVVGVLDFASFYISWTFLSSFIQILKGWDQTRTGYFATTQNVTSTITGIVVGSLMAMTRRFKTLLVGGLLIRLVGTAMMIKYRNADDPTYMLVLCQLLQGIGGGSVAITMQVAVQVTVKHSDVAIVTALELLTTEIGAAIGSATAGWMFKSYLPGALAFYLPKMDPTELNQVYGSLQAALKYPLGSAERTGIIHAWVDVMRTLSVTTTCVLVIALFFGLAIPDTWLPDVHGSLGHSQRHERRKRQSGPSVHGRSASTSNPYHSLNHGTCTSSLAALHSKGKRSRPLSKISREHESRRRIEQDVLAGSSDSAAVSSPSPS